MSDTPSLDAGLAELDRMMRRSAPEPEQPDKPKRETKREKRRRQKEARLHAR